jgi:membrane fusion protein, copper/silver efflux system
MDPHHFFSRPRRWLGGLGPSVSMAFRLVQARLRMVGVILVIFLIVGGWDRISAYWDKLTAQADPIAGPVSADTEYWCPMCPGIVSDWPGKCPVCNMDLVRRSKHDMAPLPSGVMARMQISPYRVQLAGVQTSEVRYQNLAREITADGRVVSSSSSRCSVVAEVVENDLPFLEEGQSAEVSRPAFAGFDSVAGRVKGISFTPREGIPGWQLRVAVAYPDRSLYVGTRVRIRINVPVSTRPWSARALSDAWKQNTAAELAVGALCNPSGILEGVGLVSLAGAAGARAFQTQGQVLAVPESAVVETDSKPVVYVARGQDMFDAVCVVLGPRCGDSYPVLKGLSNGDQVVTQGALLLDAESHLSPAATMYFGAGAPDSPSTPSQAPTRRSEPKQEGDQETSLAKALAQLSAADRALVEAQGHCPVNPDNRLGSMGPPCKVVIHGRTFFLCCTGCRAEALAHPDETLRKLARLKHPSTVAHD